MPRLVLINGAPGTGKSTLAQALAAEQEMALALDVDTIKHALGGWDRDPVASGLHARRLGLAVAREHLSAGYDVHLGQYLARTDFMDELASLAEQLDAQFLHVVLDIDAPGLADRLADRASSPDRTEHLVNNRLVTPADAPRLVESIEALRGVRPEAIWIDARGTCSSTLDLLRTGLSRSQASAACPEGGRGDPGL